MRLAVSTYSLSKWRRQDGATVEQCLDWLAAIGVPCVEFSGIGEQEVKDRRRRAKRLRQRCESLGLEIVSYCTGAELYKPADELKQEIERVRKEIDIAGELGAPSMRHDVTRGPQDEGVSLEQVLERIVPAVRTLTEHGEKRGVKTTLENHGFYMQTAERVGQLIDAVDHPNYGLTIDLGNFLCLNQDPVDSARKLAKYVVMAHAKDFHIKPKTEAPPSAPAVGEHPEIAHGWIHTPTDIAIRGAIAGHGNVDLPGAIDVLKQAGYDGPLSLEFEGLEDPRRGVRLGLAHLAKLTGAAQ